MASFDHACWICCSDCNCGALSEDDCRGCAACGDEWTIFDDDVPDVDDVDDWLGEDDDPDSDGDDADDDEDW